MQLKGGDEMKIHQYYLCLFLVLPLISIVLNSVLSIPLLIKIFFYSLLAHALGMFYILYSVFEIRILHEKQGSKLTLSKGKITSDWR